MNGHLILDIILYLKKDIIKFVVNSLFSKRNNKI